MKDETVSTAPDLTQRPSEDPTLTVQVRRYRRRTIFVLTWAALMWAGSISLIAFLNGNAQSLLKHGAQTTGTVIGTEWGARFSQFVTIRYEVNGQVYVEKLPFTSSASYHKGEQITVYYDPSYPDTFRTATDSRQSGEMATLIGLAIVPLGLLSLWAARTSWFALHIRRCLRHSGQWKPWTYRRLPKNGLVLTDPENTGVPVIVVLSPLGSFGDYRPPPTGTMLIAGDPKHFAMVKAEKEWRPVTVSPPRRAKKREALHKAAQELTG